MGFRVSITGNRVSEIDAIGAAGGFIRWEVGSSATTGIGIASIFVSCERVGQA